MGNVTKQSNNWSSVEYRKMSPSDTDGSTTTTELTTHTREQTCSPSEMVFPYDAVVFDIEGTICPISFVREILFPYAVDHSEDFLRRHWNDAQEVVEQLRKAAKDARDGGDNNIREVRATKKDDAIKDIVHNIRHWTALDKKIPALKKIQGMIWKEGYEKKAYEAPFYDEVIPAWRFLSADIHLYSSGSTEAQDLLLRHAKGGNDNAYFLVKGKHAASAVGPKQEVASYRNLAEEFVCKPPSKILYVTDVIEEADAAKAAGLQVMIMVREGNAPLPERAATDHTLIYNTTAVFTNDEIDRLHSTNSCPATDLLKACLETCRTPPARP